MFEAITSDLHKLPIVFVSGHNVEDLINGFEQWSLSGTLEWEEKYDIVKWLFDAKCSDGLDLAVTEQFPLNGMLVHVCFQDTLREVDYFAGWSENFFTGIFNQAAEDMKKTPGLEAKAWADYDDACEKLAARNDTPKDHEIVWGVGLHAFLFICEDVTAFKERVRGFQYAQAMQRTEDQRKFRLQTRTITGEDNGQDE